MKKLRLKEGVKVYNHDPSESFKDEVEVKKALVKSLLEKDSEAFVEILDAHLRAKVSLLEDDILRLRGDHKRLERYVYRNTIITVAALLCFALATL